MDTRGRASSPGLKGPGLGGLRGRRGVLAGLRARGNPSREAKQPRSPRSTTGSGSSAAGEEEAGGEARMGERGGAATQGCGGAERKERGEAVKGPEAGAVASPVPAGPRPDQRLPAAAAPPPSPATRPRGAARAADLRGPGLTFLLLRSLLLWKGGGGTEGRSGAPRGRAESSREGRRHAGGWAQGARATPVSSRPPRACPQATEARPLPTHLRAAP